MIQVIQEIIPEIRRVRWTEVFIRFFLLYIFLQLEFFKPFERVIQPEEFWEFKYPTGKDYVNAKWLFFFIIPFPMVLFTLIYLFKRDKLDFMASNLGYSLAVGINGIITNGLKIAVGRPRPDFLWRCFPDGQIDATLNCSNPNLRDVLQGRKSFPSGHASFAFLSFGFVTLWLMGKSNLFNDEGRGSGTRLSFSIAPLFVATLIAVSRTCDYHHHPTDVLAGGIIGFVVTYLCYRQYYPSLDCKMSSRPYPRRVNTSIQTQKLSTKTESNSVSDGKRMSSGQQQRRLDKDITESDSETKTLL